MPGPRPHTGLLVTPQAEAPACLDPEVRMGRNHFKTLRKAHGRGWELVCAAAWDTGQHSQWEQGKQIPQDPGLVHGRGSRTFGLRAQHGHGRAQPVPGYRAGRMSRAIWEGSFHK